MVSEHPHIIVIGGGIAGLAAAYRIQRRSETAGRPIRLTLLEASSRVGGVIRTQQRDGFLMEMGPDCFFSEKPGGIGLCREFGLADEIIPTRPEFRRSFLVRKKRLHPIPEGFYLLGPAKVGSFLTSPLLSWSGKLRTLAEPFIKADPRSDESLASFVRRRLGHEMLERLAQPLVSGIYAADPETLSLRATFPQFLEMERRSGSVLRALRKQSSATLQASGARYSLLVSLKRGMQSLVDALESRLIQDIRCRQPVDALHSLPQGRWRVVLASGEELTADAVCLALPAWRSARLLQATDPVLSAHLETIPYDSAMTLSLAFREKDIAHPLNGYGFVTPQVEHRSVLACTFSHHKFAGRAPKGMALLRVFAGGAVSSLLKDSESSIVATALQDLGELLGLKNGPLFYHLERHARVLPQYTLGHLDRLQSIEAAQGAWPTLGLAGNWGRGVGVPDAIASGERAGIELLAALEHRLISVAV